MKSFRLLILLFVLQFTTLGAIKAYGVNIAALQVSSTAQDTSKLKKQSETIQHRSDSSYVDQEAGITHLYGNARVIYQSFELDAEYIRYDSKKNLIFARGFVNEKGRYIGKPIFKMEGAGSSSADSLLYNSVTGKAVIYSGSTEQEGSYFSGGIAKKQPDDEIHLKGQTLSTCNLPEPHTHFGIHLTRAIVSNKLIISGPAYLVVDHVPLPIAVPFGIFPKPDKKSSGLIIGEPREDPTRGFMLENFGYYLTFNDYWDAKILGTITTRGSYNVGFTSNYLKRYKFGGNINLNFASTRLGLEGTPGYKPRKDYSITWTHSQNANARPGTTFSASVNAQTSEYNTVTAASYSYDIRQISQNALSSSISYGKVFGDGLFNLNTALRHSQETLQKTVSLTLPELSLNMSTISPFANKANLGEQKWFEKINIGYSLQARNTISTADSLLFKKEALRKFQNGFQHTIPLNLSFNLFNYLNFSTNMNYNERWYLQTINKTFKKTLLADSVITDTIGGFKRGGDYLISLSMGTKLYSNPINFKRLGNIRALRHVMTPSVSISFNPDFTNTKYGIYKNAFYTDGTPVIDISTGRQLKYSSFEQGIFGGPSSRKSASIGFGIENNVELKIADRKDTTGTGEKKLPILQNLTINGSYNFIQPTKRLSQLSFGGRSQFSDKLGVSFNGRLSPYALEINQLTNGVITRRESERYTFQDGRFPRLIDFSLSFDYSFNPDALRSKNINLNDAKNELAKTGATPEQAEQLNMISRDPNAFVDFKLPWNFAFSYSFNYSNPLGVKQVSNTLNFNGDVNLTPKWKVQFNSGFDFKAKDISYTSFNIYRDLHCWSLSLGWVPFGQYQSYSVDLRVKASILQDLKLTKRKGYYTRF